MRRRFLRLPLLGLSLCFGTGLLTPLNAALASTQTIASTRLHRQSTLQTQDTLIARVDSTFYYRPSDKPPKLAANNAEWNDKDRQVQFWVRNTGTITASATTQWTLLKDGVAVGQGDLDATTVVEGTKRLFKLTDRQLIEESDKKLTSGRYKLVGKLSWNYESESYSQPFELSFDI